jgi:hypothetical protein
MHFTKTILALAVGMISTASAHAATPYTGTVLYIDAGVLASEGEDPIGVTSGSWFAMDYNDSSTISDHEKTALSQGRTGLIIGTTTTAGASHDGVPVAGDTNLITAPWAFFGATGSDYNTVAITGSTESGLNMSGWTVTWKGIPAIDMGNGAWGAGYSNGVGNFSWDGTDGGAYTLDYHATVPIGDTSGFGGVKYALHLEGCVGASLETVCAIPEVSTYAMMLAGLGLVGFASRRGRQVSRAVG